MTRILGVDPGLTRCGVGVVDVDNRRNCVLVDVFVSKTKPGAELAARIGDIAAEIESAIAKHKPEKIALERVFAQANLKTVMGVAQISGVVLYLASKHEIPLSFYTPSEVKAAVTGSGRAPKDQVGTMVAKILKLDEIPKPADAADALAIAITAAWKIVPTLEGREQTKAQRIWQEAQAAAANSNKR
jgi:crossover junction endodeoxyribonuclease RuvC